MAAETEFCLLGPLLVRHRGIVVPVPPGKQRALLAALLMSAGRLVAVDELAEVLWGADPPPSARASLHNCVMRLRKSLADAGLSRITTQPDGYLISLGPGELDIDQFESSLTAGREAARVGSWAAAAALLRTALALWRGQPLSGVPSDALALREVPRLTEMWLQALEARIDADLYLGRHSEVILELRQLATAHPLRERLHALLMIALYRDGRQAGALAAYQAARRMLVDELGTEPGHALRQLHQQILRGDSALAVEPAGVGGRAGQARAVPAHQPDRVVPRQLPGAASHFVGRVDELRLLTGILGERGSPGGPVMISVISGTAGVGKTALAMHWAHLVAARFTDGQLYLNLRGFDPSRPPVTPEDAVRRLLDALDVPAERIPPSTEAQEGLYRSLLAGRRVLIVLDNARDVDQVRPLLPGGHSCSVVVTSRNQLAGLTAAAGASQVCLEVLPYADARQLLDLRLGAQRVAGEPEAVEKLIELCAQLPLALTIAAARASAHPAFPLAVLAAELQQAGSKLDILDGGDAASNVRAVFSWSCKNLSAPAARMFRLLGVHPGPDISVVAAASLAGLRPRQARHLLGELARANLLTEHAPARFAFHDLLRAYAADQASASVSSAGRRAAVSRVLDHYLHTARAAGRRLYPHRQAITLTAPQSGVTLDDGLTSHAQALAWFDAEHRVLLAVISLAADAGFSTHAWQLPWTMETFFYRRGHWHDWAATQHTALAAAQRLGDQFAQTQAFRGIASAQIELGRYDDALCHLTRALRLSEDAADLRGQARIQLDFARAFDHQGRNCEAVSHCRRALRLSRAAGDQAKVTHADALNHLGWNLARIGRYQQGLASCRRALVLQRQLGDKHSMPTTLDSLAYAHRHLGHHAEAADCYRQAVELYAEFGFRYQKAETLTYAGDAHHAGGDIPAALDAWTQALAILDDLHHPDADQVRASLSRLA